MRDAAELGTVLGVWAHPDDDIYLSAGLMAAAVNAGQRVVDVTATRGEGGSMDEEKWPPATMGDVRTKELLRSLDVLGVKEDHFLEGPVDTDMDTGLDPAAEDQVRQVMEEVGPDTILTFGPEGMTGHVAHQDVSRWAGEAFSEVAKPGRVCITPSSRRAWPTNGSRSSRRSNLPPRHPQRGPGRGDGSGLELLRELLDLKIASIKEHVSQIEAL